MGNQTRQIALLVFPAILWAAVLNGEDTGPSEPNSPGNQPPERAAPDSPDARKPDLQKDALPSALELHHARQQYRELYSLSESYREMLNVLKQNYGPPSNLASPHNADEKDPEKAFEKEDSDSPIRVNPEPEGNDSQNITVEECPTRAYLEYSRNEVTSALTTVRICVQKQRNLLVKYARAMADNTDSIVNRLSGRIETLMGASSFSLESISSRKLNKGRSMLQFSLRVTGEARDSLEENPEMAISRLRVARFQAIQGLILLETSYTREQELKKEFETAILDAEGKVYIKPLDESQYQKGPAPAEQDSQEDAPKTN